MSKKKWNKKDRKHSGREVAKIYKPVECPYEFTYWNDWNDRRDGMRDFSDRTLKHSHIILPNYFFDEERREQAVRDLEKIKRKEIIRKQRRYKKRLLHTT